MTLVINEAATANACTNITATNQLAELSNNCSPVVTKSEPQPDKKDYRLNKSESQLVNSLAQGLNMDKMLQSVDSKLDRLADKVELLEKQISNLLKNMEINKNDGQRQSSSESSSGKSSCQDLNVTSKAMLLNDLKYLDQAQHATDKTVRSEKLASLNSPDSLLSSPILNSNNAGSCLLFNDLY